MSDRRLWLDEPCPTCRVTPGRRCQTHAYMGKPIASLHHARGWRQRACPSCKAVPGEPCHTPTGRPAARPHTARLRYGRHEPTLEAVWQELGAQWGAAAAIVRFTGGAGQPGTIVTVVLEDAQERGLAQWSSGEGPLPDELAAPIWGRYARFRGHPRIVAALVWDVEHREVVTSGRRGDEAFSEVLIAQPRTLMPSPPPNDTSRDTSPAGVPSIPPPVRVCERCGASIPATARAEAKYCSKLCRQAASRARLRARSGRADLHAPARCQACAGPMPAGLRPEALYCSKRCRQAASRARLAGRT